MMISLITIKLYAPWVHSLKEKRMIVKSVIAKVRNKFNVSIIEAGQQDVHQTIVMSMVYLAAGNAQADSIMEEILSFVETNTEAEITEVRKEER